MVMKSVRKVIGCGFSIKKRINKENVLNVHRQMEMDRKADKYRERRQTNKYTNRVGIISKREKENTNEIKELEKKGK